MINEYKRDKPSVVISLLNGKFWRKNECRKGSMVVSNKL